MKIKKKKLDKCPLPNEYVHPHPHPNKIKTPSAHVEKHWLKAMNVNKDQIYACLVFL